MARARILVVLLFVALPALSQDGELRAQSLLQPPLTPGGLAVAAGNRSPSAFSMIRAGLAHADPDIRAVAARLVAVSLLADFVPDVVRTLGTEQDDAVAAELVQAAMDMNTAETIAAVEAYLPRAGRRSRDAYAFALARGSIEKLLHVLPAIAAVSEADGHTNLAIAVALASQRTPNRAGVATEAWLSAASPAGWREYLRRTVHLRFGQAALRAGLATTNAKSRSETVWHLVEMLVDDVDVPSGVIAAALPAMGVEAPETWEQFGREVIARARRNARPVDRSVWVERMVREHRHDALRAAMLNVTSDERAAIVRVLGDAASREGTDDQRGQRATPRTAQPSMRTVPRVTNGFLGSVLRASGCSTTTGRSFVLFQVTYRGDGRPDSVIIDGNPSAGCQAATRAVILTLLADPAYPVKAGDKQLVMLPLHNDVVACMDLPVPHYSGGDTADFSVGEEPKRVHYVPPQYPESSSHSGVAGTVVVESIIARTGCVRSGEVLRSVTPALNHAALIAVMQWRYTPTLVNREPAEVQMTVTVNFTLQ